MNLDPTDPLKNMLSIIKGFNLVKKLSEEEKIVLFPLIKVRLAYLCLHTCERHAKVKDDEYVKKTKEAIADYLKIISSACSNAVFLELLR